MLDYNPGTGVFRWKVATRRKPLGSVAGSVRVRYKYRLISIDGQAFYAHRLAWLIVHGTWPQADIDHINGDRSDNRLKNLRECVEGTNQQNITQARRHNHCGVLGVKKRGNSYGARIKLNNREQWLGSFQNAEEAHAAYIKAKRKLHPFGTL